VNASPRPALGSSRAAPAWRATLAQAAMELRLTSRRGENLLVTLVIPVVMLAFFASVPVLSVGTDRPVDFLLPGVLALAVISTSLVNLGIATAYERSYGVLKRLGGSPLPRAGLIAAKMLAVLVVETLQVTLLVAIAVLGFGWTPGPGANLALALAAILLGTLAFAGIGLAMAGALRAEATLAGANALFLALLLLGGIILPLDHLPAALEALARILPASALSDTLRIGLGSQPGDAGGTLALLAAWGLGASAIAARTFRWE
jgi:ABC-2 type transport system permease protein